MSLLNEALRKKNKEQNKPDEKISAPFSAKKSNKDHTSNNLKKYGTIIIALLVTFLMILEFWQTIFPEPPKVKRKPLIPPAYTEKINKVPATTSSIMTSISTTSIPTTSITPIETSTVPFVPKTELPATLPPKTEDKQVKDESIKSNAVSKSAIKKNTSMKKGKKKKKKSYAKKRKKSSIKRYKKAIPRLSKNEVKTDTYETPVDNDLFYKKGLNYQNLNMFDDAINMYEEVLKKHPENSTVLFNLSSIYISKKSYSEGYSILSKLVNRKPDNPELLINLAISQIGLGKIDDAVFTLRHAEKIPTANRFALYFHKGIALSKLGKLNEAITSYKEAEKSNPNNPRLLFNMALSYDKMQNYDEAVRYYTYFLKYSISEKEQKEIKNRIRELSLYKDKQEE
ncbi:MAG: tetratricopeptide repeat protein [Desulfobacterales bacterium]|nr:tetratricopeptide repeat protein [Desulfobacterales bacterium]